jgi:nucleotide-binding universal stress UspA family protein
LARKKRIVFGKQWRARPHALADAKDMKKPNIQTILVPIDFSKMSIQAIETAKKLAQRFQATIHLVHVRHFDYPIGFVAPTPPLVPFSVATYDQNAEKKLSRQLRDLARKHYDLPHGGNCHIQTGAPAFDEICRLARDLGADLIVMPTHGHTGLKRIFLGSTAERVVQHSPCPVFVSRWREGRFDKILVPVDFSGCSLDGLNYAIRFADRVAAKLILFHAVHLGYAHTSDGFAMYDLSVFTEAARKDAERQMRQFVRTAKFGGVKFETAIKVGPPVEEVCAFAKRRDIDLIITATHGRTGFEHVLIGSTAEHVVRHAPCAVLVVPSHPKIRAATLRRKAGRTRKQSQRRLLNGAVRRKKPAMMAEFTRKNRKLTVSAFPERRQINKFRESHLKP